MDNILYKYLVKYQYETKDGFKDAEMYIYAEYIEDAADIVRDIYIEKVIIKSIETVEE